MKRFILITVLSFLLCPAFGQSGKYISFELGGSGGIASFNYEKVLKSFGTDHFPMRYGISFAPLDANNGNSFVFPIMFHSKWGGNGRFADLGIGQALTLTTRGSAFIRMPLSIGYRFEPEEKRYCLRAAYTPIVSYIFNFQWENWAGLAFGYQL
ncbi:MAG: hypothetical protein ACPG21_04315 [Crocinitomicaceae bacterium]